MRASVLQGRAAWLMAACLCAHAVVARGAALRTSGRLDLNTMAGFAGARQLGSESSALLQWGGSIDTADAGWWHGGHVTFSIEGVRSGGKPTAGTRVLQWPDNEWAPNFLRVYQLTVRQQWRSALVRAGIMDLNQYFEASDVADMLHNASFGLAPTFTSNFNDPSFPNPGLGAMLQWSPTAAWSARAGIWQGDPPSLSGALRRGSLDVFEVERDWDEAAGDALASDVKAGVWRYNASGAMAGGDTAGAYVVAETRWRHAQQRWGAFVLAGNAPAWRNVVRHFVAGGLLVAAPFASRPSDSFSAGVTEVGVSGLRPETVAEATYSWQLAPDLALQPDVQRVWDAAGQAPAAWIAGVRVHLSF